MGSARLTHDGRSNRDNQVNGRTGSGASVDISWGGRPSAAKAGVNGMVQANELLALRGDLLTQCIGVTIGGSDVFVRRPIMQLSATIHDGKPACSRRIAGWQVDAAGQV